MTNKFNEALRHVRSFLVNAPEEARMCQFFVGGRWLMVADLQALVDGLSERDDARVVGIPDSLRDELIDILRTVPGYFQSIGGLHYPHLVMRERIDKAIKLLRADTVLNGHFPGHKAGCPRMTGGGDPPCTCGATGYQPRGAAPPLTALQDLAPFNPNIQRLRAERLEAALSGLVDRINRDAKASNDIDGLADSDEMFDARGALSDPLVVPDSAPKMDMRARIFNTRDGYEVSLDCPLCDGHLRGQAVMVDDAPEGHRHPPCFNDQPGAVDCQVCGATFRGPELERRYD